MAEDWIKPVRIALGVANFIFIIVGSVLIGLGIWIFLEAEEYVEVFDKGSPYGAALVSIVTGILVVVGSFFGCIGAFVKNRVLLICYLGILMFILLAQVVLIALSLQFRNKAKENVRDELVPAVMNYGQTGQDEINGDVEKIQRDFDCCGANGVNDWTNSNNAWRRVVNNTKILFPKSCCKEVGVTDCNENMSNAFTKNCLSELSGWAEEKLMILAAVSIALLFFQIFGIIIGVALLRMTPSAPDNSDVISQ